MALAQDFVAFSRRFIAHANKLHPTEDFSIESADVERTASVLQPLRGKLVARMRGKELNSNDFRLTYWFDRTDNKWAPTQPDIEVVRRGRGFSVELVEQMRQLERRKAESITILAYKDAETGG